MDIRKFNEKTYIKEGYRDKKINKMEQMVRRN
jgi:hypothetical protein